MKRDNEDDDDVALLANMERLDDAVGSPAPGVLVSGARAAADAARLRRLRVALVVVAARSLCAQCDDPSLLLDVTPTTTREECAAFFDSAYRRCASRWVSGAGEPWAAPMRLYIGLDDNGKQDLKPVAVVFARFLAQVLRLDAFDQRGLGGGGVGGDAAADGAPTRGAAAANVLVHCVQGKSRSVALVAAFLMFGGGTAEQQAAAGSTQEQQRPLMMLHDALDIIRATRPIAQVNPCFGAQLFSLYARACREASAPPAAST